MRSGGLAPALPAGQLVCDTLMPRQRLATPETAKRYCERHAANLPLKEVALRVKIRHPTLHNPTAELTQRVPIDELGDLKSRPARHDEPWFPCRREDWVILSNGIRGRVTAISPETVQMVERGGAQVTCQTADFLAA